MCLSDSRGRDAELSITLLDHFCAMRSFGLTFPPILQRLSTQIHSRCKRPPHGRRFRAASMPSHERLRRWVPTGPFAGSTTPRLFASHSRYVESPATDRTGITHRPPPAAVPFLESVCGRLRSIFRHLHLISGGRQAMGSVPGTVGARKPSAYVKSNMKQAYSTRFLRVFFSGLLQISNSGCSGRLSGSIKSEPIHDRPDSFRRSALPIDDPPGGE